MVFSQVITEVQTIQWAEFHTIFLPRNIQHAFIQLSEKARVLVSYTSAGKMESFFETTDSWNTPPSEDLIKKTFTDHAVGKAPHHKNLLI